MNKARTTAYSGGLTQGVRKRMAKAITIMCQAVRPSWKFNPVTNRYFHHHFSFITLTISSSRNLDGREAYEKLLSHFLDWLTRTKGVKTYVWKKEFQKRGQVHYHLTSPCVIHHKEVRKKWNNLQREAGLLDEYAAKHGHFNPPSTEIRKTEYVKNAANYLIKELGKALSAIQVKAQSEVKDMVKRGIISEQEAEKKLEEIMELAINDLGRVWGCSADLAGVGYFTVEQTERHRQLIFKWIAEGRATLKEDDFFSIVLCNDVDPPDLLDSIESRRMRDYLDWVMTRYGEREQVADRPDIPVQCVDMKELNVETHYTYEQLTMSLN